MTKRSEKVSHAIQREIQLILHDEMKDPRLGFVTITKVDIADDLRHAKVHFSVLGNQDEYKKTKEALDSAAGFIRTLVTQRINLKFSPELHFAEDHSAEYSIKIQQIIEEIKNQKDAPHGTPEEENHGAE